MVHRCRRRAGGVLLIAAAILVAGPGLPASPDELADARRDAIVAARETQHRERTVAAIQHQIDLLERDLAGRRRGLDESRAEQDRLLGTLLHLARSPARGGVAVADSLIDQARGDMLMQAAEPALRAQARALAGEIARIALLRQRIDARRQEQTAALQALATGQEVLADAAARRNALVAAMLPAESGTAARSTAGIAGGVTGLANLIESAQAAAERRNRDSEAVNPTRPRVLRSLIEETDPQPAEGHQIEGQQTEGAPVLIAPVAGEIFRRAGEPRATGMPNDGVSLIALAGATVVAPFDGKVIYAGPFRNLRLVLIIRHDHLYYSLLAGLDRVDAVLDEWVLAGEPVGTLPGMPPPRSRSQAEELEEGLSGRSLYYELRRDGRPVDPQPWMASVEDGRDERNGDQKVRQ